MIELDPQACNSCGLMPEPPCVRVCPGDIIDTRIIPWGAVKAGMHEFVIDVPDATFAAMQGNFPFSLYVQAE